MTRTRIERWTDDDLYETEKPCPRCSELRPTDSLKFSCTEAVGRSTVTWGAICDACHRAIVERELRAANVR